jgi:hypothetical protein
MAEITDFRERYVEKARMLEYLNHCWNLIEGGVAIAAGALAGSRLWWPWCGFFIENGSGAALLRG